MTTHDEQFLSRIQPRQRLAIDIAEHIRVLYAKRVMRQRAVFSILSAVSFVLVVPAVQLFFSQGAQSGFFEYLALVTTSAIVTSGKELISVLVSSLPCIAVVATSAALFGGFWSLRKAVLASLPAVRFI